MTTPALVVDGKVKVAGKVPSVEEIKKMLAVRAAPDGAESAKSGSARCRLLLAAVSAVAGCAARARQAARCASPRRRHPSRRPTQRRDARRRLLLPPDHPVRDLPQVRSAHGASAAGRVRRRARERAARAGASWTSRSRGTRADVAKYDIFDSSVVVSSSPGSNEVEWKKLDDIWGLVGYEDAFIEYIQGEVGAYLGGAANGE